MGNKNSISTVKLVVVIAIGAALYGLGGLLSITIFTNTSLKPAMAVLGLWAAAFGPVVGFLVGFIGHFLTDTFAGWGVWWTWILGSGIVGALIGLYPRITHNSLEDGVFGGKEIAIFVVLSLLANFIGYAISAVLDYFIFAEPLAKVIAQQLIVSVVNTVVIGILGSIFMKLLANRYKNTAELE